MWHGTTDEALRSIMARGLGPEAYLTSDAQTAREFARSRSRWNGRRPLLFAVATGALELREREDRQGRVEWVAAGVIPWSALRIVGHGADV